MVPAKVPAQATTLVVLRTQPESTLPRLAPPCLPPLLAPEPWRLREQTTSTPGLVDSLQQLRLRVDLEHPALLVSLLLDSDRLMGLVLCCSALPLASRSSSEETTRHSRRLLVLCSTLGKTLPEKRQSFLMVYSFDSLWIYPGPSFFKFLVYFARLSGIYPWTLLNTCTNAI